MFLFLIPVLGLALGVAIFDERVGVLQGGGVLVIAGGLLAVARAQRGGIRGEATRT